MSGLFPAGSDEGEEERTGAGGGGGERKGRDASVGAVCAGRGHPRVVPPASIRLWDRKRVLPP